MVAGASGEPRREGPGLVRGLWRMLEAYGWPRLMAFLAWLALLVCTYGSLVDVLDPDELSLLGLVELKTVPLLLAVLVALPNVTLFIVARMIMFRFSRRQYILHFGESEGLTPVSEAARSQAQSMWIYERNRAATCYEAGLLPQVAVFGLLSSSMLAFCVLGIHLPAKMLFPNLAGEPPVWHIWVAWTVLSTATTSFLLSMGRILVRVASNDATTRTFANAARSYGLCVVSAAMLACLTLSDTAERTAQMSIAMGIAVGLLGDRAFLAVSNRAAAMLGAEAEVVESGVGLRMIEGVTGEDLQRLQEENISSVHALAFAPVPRLFFNSSLNLRRICDWQDQALLQVYLGESRAKALREHFQIRGAVDAQRLASSLVDLPPEAWQQLLASMSLPSETHLRQLFARLEHDPRIDELRAYRSASLRMEAVHPNDELGPIAAAVAAKVNP